MKRTAPIGICALLGVLALLCAGTAQARHHQRETQGGVPGQFDYYLLTLSWSPAYCVLHPQDGAQCQGRGYGFVLHGLWPQFDTGGYPQFCGDPRLPPDAFALGARIYPSPKLVNHEWERHGTCSGLGPRGYFQAADRALEVIKVPRALQAPRADLSMTGSQVVAAFQSANPGLPGNAVQVSCSRGELSEVRVCLTRDLRTRSCGRGVRSSCPSYPVRVRSVR